MSLFIKYGVMAQVDSGKKTVFTLETTVASGNEIPIYLGKPDTNTLYISVNGTLQHTVGTDVSGNFNRTLTLNAEAENVVKVWVNQGTYTFASGTVSSAVIGGTNSSYRAVLKNSTIGKQLAEIGSVAFYSSLNLLSVTLFDTLTSIGTSAFVLCSGIESITLPDSITNISNNAFSGCTNLATINLPNSLTSINNTVFNNCSSLQNLALPSVLEFIGMEAFRNCSSFTSVSIPNSVTVIGARAYNGCSSLASVTVLAVTPPTLGLFVFDDTNHAPIYVPSGSVDAYKTATNWSTYASRIEAIA